METRPSFPKLKRYTLMAVFTAAMLCRGAYTEVEVEEYLFEKYLIVFDGEFIKSISIFNILK